jgi:hypothetical protein
MGFRRLPANQRHELVGGAQSFSFHPRRPLWIIVIIVAITIDYDKDEASPMPPRQNVTFLAPVGLENWTPSMTESPGYLLPMLRTPPILVTSDNHVTPVIRIWTGFDPSWSSLCRFGFFLVQVYARVELYLFSTVT